MPVSNFINNISSVKRSKYNAKEVIVDGIKFASCREAKRYAQLKIRAQYGMVRDLKLQVAFRYLGKSGKALFKYIADFTYTDETGTYVVEDAKGFKTPVYRLKKKLIEDQYGFEIKEI